MLEFTEENFKKMYEALKRIANPNDKCHHGYEGPWIDVAFETLHNRKMSEEDYLTDDNK